MKKELKINVRGGAILAICASLFISSCKNDVTNNDTVNNIDITENNGYQPIKQPVGIVTPARSATSRIGSPTSALTVI